MRYLNVMTQRDAFIFPVKRFLALRLFFFPFGAEIVFLDS